MIKLTVLVKRNPALSVEEFHAAWRVHGKLIADDPGLSSHIVRYEQHHRTIEDYRNGDQFDGMALQWFESFGDFMGFVGDPAYAAKIQPDEEQLLDMSGLVVIFTEEAEVFIS